MFVFLCLFFLWENIFTTNLFVYWPAGQVSVFNLDQYTLTARNCTVIPHWRSFASGYGVTRKQISGFFIQGDLNWRSNISGQPFLSQLYSPFFGVGLLLATVLAVWYFFAPVKKEKYWPFFLLAVWFWGMLLPVVATAEGIPHGLRTIGVIPAVFIISAWMLYEFGALIWKLHKKLWDRVLTHYKDPQWLRDHTLTPPRMRIVNLGLKLVVVCFVLALTGQAYFYILYTRLIAQKIFIIFVRFNPGSKYLVDRCQQSVILVGRQPKIPLI